MQAIIQDRYGDTPEDVLRVGEVTRPSAGRGEVLVRVRAASLDRGTWHVMTGVPYLMRIMGFGFRRPKQPNPGRSVAGTVESVGDDVTKFAPDDDVYGTADGSFAEYATVPLARLAHKPSNLSLAEAAAVPISGLAALQAVRDRAQVRRGDHVLVIGAAGGVGAFALQIAKAEGATVTGVAGTASLELVRTLGADHVVDYTRDDFADGDHRYDVIIDTAGHRALSHLRRGLARRGRLVIVGSETGGRWTGGFGRSLRASLLSPFVSQRLMMLSSKETASGLDDLRDLIESGRVVAPIARVYPLRETAAAMRELIDGSARGKLVIQLD
jgi:NADPH:quinone reductase-like Zn-dependent oxidoreductase